VADQIQDIGISFMRISRYLLMEGIRKALKSRFEIERE
jgi:cAMP-specific phosphodiesterase 4